MATTHFELVTPSRTIFSGEAEMIVCRAVEGEIAFLAGHMPYIGALDPCVVRIVGVVDPASQPVDGEIRVAVRGGFVEVKDSRVIMLADLAELASDVDVEQARRDAAQTGQGLAGGPSEEASGDPLDVDRRWAQVRLEAAGAT